MTIHYRALYRLGYWCSLEAECRSEPSAEFPTLIKHEATVVLLNKFGDRLHIDSALFTGQADRVSVYDEDGETFPTLAVAVRARAAALMTIAVTPGAETWKEKPPCIDTWQGTVATAFDRPAP